MSSSLFSSTVIGSIVQRLYAGYLSCTATWKILLQLTANLSGGIFVDAFAVLKLCQEAESGNLPKPGHMNGVKDVLSQSNAI